MYLEFTMNLCADWVVLILLFVNLIFAYILFLVRENILEFLKYVVYLVIMTIAYIYIEPYITYRGEDYLNEKAIRTKHQESCMKSIRNENELREKLKIWEEDESQKGIHEFETILFFLNSENNIEINMDKKESHSKGKKVVSLIRERVAKYSIRKAINRILTLNKEERVIYKTENICSLAKRYDLIYEIESEDDKDREVHKFIFETCEGY
jgi:hypothetical protein